LEIVQPLIIKTIIDNELAGVETVWVKTAENENTIEFAGEFYQKDDGKVIGDRYTIQFFNDSYLLISGVMESKDKVTALSDTATIEREDKSVYTLSYRKLTTAEMMNFFRRSVNPIITMIIIYAVISVVILIARYIQRIAFTASSMRLTLDMRKSAFVKLNHLPIAYFSKEPKGKTVTKMIYDSEGVRGIYDVVFSILSAAITLVLIYIGLFALEWRMALLTLLAFPLVFLWMTLYRKVVNKYNHMIRETNSRINGKLAEFVNGTGIIQLFNKEKKMTGEYDELLKDNYRIKIRHLNINTVFGFEMLNLIHRVLVAGIIIYFCYQYFTPGVVVIGTTVYVYIDYLGRIINPISDIFSNLNAFEDSLVSASRIFEFLDEPEDAGVGEVTGVKVEGDVEFQHIRFSYEDGNNVLNNISFHVKPGQFIGLVGKTGSGKSTLMSLLERYYDIENGQILLDGIDYKTYSKQDVRNNIGIILQDPSIFEGTIKSNIAFGMDVEDEKIEGILTNIGATKFVNGFKDGIHTKVAYMGENLSTGEKQLIAFARILLRNPSIMILDEATANIDTETEGLIQNALTVLSKSRTTFVVAHRLSTIRNADMIYVIDDGKIIESGNHQELYAIENGVYRSMYDALQ
jgi:ATP-binding cassette subfamily B protein